MKSRTMIMLAGLSGLLAGSVPPLSTQYRVVTPPLRKRDKEYVKETIKKAEEKRNRRANKRALHN